MAKGSIPRPFIDDLLNRADITEVINARVPLKKAGSTYKACCPFHDEKTPSFNVNPQQQFYHCFGCGASGDALKFLMEYDGLSFVEAVESLASQYGMQVPYEQKSPQAQKAQQERQQQQANLYDVMLLTAKFYRFQLRDHPQSETAKQYLRDRGLSPQVAQDFYIGFAPAGWDNLIKGLSQANTQITNLKPLLVESGMVVEKPEQNKSYDRFRERIMFPIRDGRGRVIAFGGRVLSKEQQPKYLNSPETPIFHKSQTLYGLYEMRQSRQKFDHILVVEGYMDVVALAQFGIRNAVATLGTAVTIEHLQILFKQVNEVVVCFDGDAAGMKAAWKALELALPMMEENRSVKFLFLDQGEDPDSTVRKEGVHGFNARIDKALSLSQFLIQGLEGKLGYAPSTIEGRQQLVSLATPFIKLATGLYQYLLIEGLAEKVDLPTWRLEKQMQIFTGFAKSPRDARKAAQEQSQPAGMYGAKVFSVPLKIARLLLEMPVWSSVFYAELLTDLQQAADKDCHALVGFVQTLQTVDWNQVDESEQQTMIRNWLLQNGQKAFLDSIEAISLPPAESRYEEFDSLLHRLIGILDEQKLGAQGWTDDELKRLSEMKGGRSKKET